MVVHWFFMRIREFSSAISCVAECEITSILPKCSLSCKASSCCSEVAASELRRTPTVSQICSQCLSRRAGLPRVRISGRTLLNSLNLVCICDTRWRTSLTSGKSSPTCSYISCNYQPVSISIKNNKKIFHSSLNPFECSTLNKTKAYDPLESLRIPKN